MAKRIICDLDNTITMHSSATSYEEKAPNQAVIDKLRSYHKAGYEIVIFTARNMNSFSGDIEKINKITVPIILDWLTQHNVPFDDLIVGKPWCDEGFYVDDRAIRPSEFIELSEEEIFERLK